MKKINKMFQNLDNIDNLSLINLDDYFCEGMMCSFYRNNETKIYLKRGWISFIINSSKRYSKLFE